MVDRLGGWRPEGFLGNGLELAAWMALTTVMAAWLWLRGPGGPFGLPSWPPRRWRLPGDDARLPGRLRLPHPGDRPGGGRR